MCVRVRGATAVVEVMKTYPIPVLNNIWKQGWPVLAVLCVYNVFVYIHVRRSKSSVYRVWLDRVHEEELRWGMIGRLVRWATYIPPMCRWLEAHDSDCWVYMRQSTYTAESVTYRTQSTYTESHTWQTRTSNCRTIVTEDWLQCVWKYSYTNLLQSLQYISVIRRQFLFGGVSSFLSHRS